MADDTQAQTLSNAEVREQIRHLEQRAYMMMHLEGNCIFILPPAVRGSHDTMVGLVDIALEALDIANSYDAQYGVNNAAVMAQELALPDGMEVNGKTTMAVSDVIDFLRLESMVYDVLECAYDDESYPDFEDDDGALRMESEIPHPFDE